MRSARLRRALWGAGGTPALLFALAIPIHGETIAVTSRGIVVAHPNTIELFDARGRELLWRAEGVAHPSRIVVSADRVAVLDPLADEVRIVELANGRGTTSRTRETPIDGVFVGRELYVLDRDARVVERVRDHAVVQTGPDPAFLREANGVLYVYTRGDGVVSEIAATPFAMRRTASVAPFASDFEIDAKNGYLVFPRSGKIRFVSLRDMKASGEIPIGAVPVDVAFAGGGSAITARTLAVADPAAKRVWLIEGQQSFGEAVARGFLRGLLGLGLYSGGKSQFPTGVDRVFRGFAYDSASGTLYRYTKSASAAVAKGIGPQEFALTDAGVVVWESGRLRMLD